MKFEIVSGDEKLFDGAPEWSLFVSSYDGDHYWEEHRNPILGGKFQHVGFNYVRTYDCIPKFVEQEILAERRPIAETEWNGEGLPPVGVECEFQAALGNWVAIRITAHGEDSMLMKQVGKDNEQYISKDRKFRPIRSAEEIARDNAIGALEKEWEQVTGKPAFKFEAIYDAIATGKIPGIKLE